MPTTIAALALVLATISAPTLLAQTDPVVASRAEYREAVKAYEAHDTVAFLRHARRPPASAQRMAACSTPWHLPGRLQATVP